jgi:hypothetical protein
MYARSLVATALTAALYCPASHHLWSMLCWIALASWWVVGVFFTLAKLERITESILPTIRFIGASDRRRDRGQP